MRRRAEDLRPGDIFDASGDEILSIHEHETYRALVVRSTNGEPTIRNVDRGTFVTTRALDLPGAFARIFGAPMLPMPHRFDDPSLTIDEPDEPIADDWEADHAADRFFDR